MMVSMIVNDGSTIYNFPYFASPLKTCFFFPSAAARYVGTARERKDPRGGLDPPGTWLLRRRLEETCGRKVTVKLCVSDGSYTRMGFP